MLFLSRNRRQHVCTWQVEQRFIIRINLRSHRYGSFWTNIFITRSQPEVIRQILEHLGLWEKSRQPPVETETFQDVIQEPFNDG